MSTQAQPVLNIEQLAQAYEEIQNQLSNAKSQFTALKTELDQTKQAQRNSQVKLTAQHMASNNAAQAGIQSKKMIRRNAVEPWTQDTFKIIVFSSQCVFSNGISFSSFLGQVRIRS